MKNVGEILRADADRAGIPLRTLTQVREGLAKAKKTKADVTLARTMLRFGRMTDEAHAWISAQYPSCAHPSTNEA